MKKSISLILSALLCFCAAFTAFVSADTAENTYTVTLRDLGGGSYKVTATVPEGVSFGKLVLSVSDSLTLKEGSLSSVAGAVVNEAYEKDGVSGACVIFTLISALPEGSVVFSATYTALEGAEISLADLSAPEWHIGTDGVRTATQADGEPIYIYEAYDPATDSSEADNSSAEDSGEESVAPNPADAGYVVTLAENADGSYTVYATSKGGVNSGKLVISVSENLSLVSGSVKGIMGAMVNESYDRGGVTGVCVSFSTLMSLSETSVVFSATYTAAEGAEISLDDISAPEWNLGLNGEKLASQADGTVTYLYKAHSHDYGEWIKTDTEHYKKCACGLEAERDNHDYTNCRDYDCNTCGAERALKGDANGDRLVDNLDAVAILKQDAMLLELEGESLLMADVNGDGEVNNLDAVYVLKFEAGIIDEL